MNNNIIGYVYEAAYHCESCTAERFPKLRGTDSEGNEISPSFDHEEQLETVSCDDCHEVLVEVECIEPTPRFKLYAVK
jgi:hypothetical protein